MIDLGKNQKLRDAFKELIDRFLLQPLDEGLKSAIKNDVEYFNSLYANELIYQGEQYELEVEYVSENHIMVNSVKVIEKKKLTDFLR